MTNNNHNFVLPREPIDLWAEIAKGEAARDRLDRAKRITDRLMPKVRAPHGWDNPMGFIEACNHEAARRDLYRHVHLALELKDRAKARETVA